ncbi:MAG: EI24 domain-containing protein [Planctomycetes bacterium]|nr:EI24 domain-containing protein [Planctomycetota bacterium]
MLRAFSLAFGQLFDRRVLGVLGTCALLSLAVFVGLWWLIDWLLTDVWVTTGWAHTTLDWFGAFAAVLLAWFLFPVVTSAFVGLFLERVATLVERRHYPYLTPAPGLPFHQALAASLQFLALVVAANVLLLSLLLLWFLPFAYPVGFFVVNGLLLGREYFDLVALRRLDRARTRTLRAAHAGELLLTGAGLAFLLTVPLLNLVTPVFATAMMVHRFERWRGDQLAAGGG